MRTGCIIQARTSSTRLPGKVLMPLPYNSDVTVLQQVIRRARAIRGVHEVIVATTPDQEDKKIVEISEKEKVRSFIGSKENVLERFFLAAEEYKLDQIIRITSDCPCLDPALVSELLEKHIEKGADYSSNCLERKYPHGLDAEVIRFSALESAYKNASELFEREHVTPFIYKSNPDLFKLYSHIPRNADYPYIRVTMDTVEDYTALCAVYDYLFEKDRFFLLQDIVTLFDKKPWLKLINGNIRQKKIFNSLEEELKEAVLLLELQGLGQASTLIKNFALKK